MEEVMFPIIIFAIILGIELPIFITLGLRAYKTKKLIQETPTSSIMTASPGIVELKGNVKPIPNTPLLKSPLSSVECVYYDIQIQEYRSNKNNRGWYTIFNESQKIDFILEDGTGRAFISVDQADISLNNDQELEQDNKKELPENVLQYLESKKIKTKILGFKKVLRVLEKCLKPGDEIYVLGFAEKNYDVVNKTNIQLRKEKKFPYIISDSKEEEIIKSYKGQIILSVVIPFFTLLLAIIFVIF